MTQKQKVVFPIWIQNSYEGTDRLNEHKAMVFLAKHFGDKINQKLKSKNIEYKFTLQYFDGDDSETPSLEACERVIGWINDTDNCFFSFFPRIARDPERTFEKRNNKKILFTLGDESWKTTPPDFCFDLNPKSITNMETLGWLSGKPNIQIFFFFIMNPPQMKNICPSCRQKIEKKISSLQIDPDLDGKEIEERLTKAVSGLGNNPLIVTNLFHGSISGEDFADLFLASLKNVETNTTVLCLGYFEHLIALRNNNPRVEVLRKFVPPWSNQSVIEVNAKIFGKKHNALLDWVSDQELAQFEFANLTADIIAKSNLDLTADGFLEHVDRKIVSYNGAKTCMSVTILPFDFQGGLIHIPTSL